MYLFLQFILPQDAPTPLEESQRGNTMCDARKACFKTQDDLDEFELSWHLSVYKPAWNELLSKVQSLINCIRCARTQHISDFYLH